MKNKLLAAVMGAIVLVCATVPAPAQQKKDPLDEVIQFCYNGMKAYRSGEAGRQAVADALSKMPKDKMEAVTVVCRAFTTGYDQGQHDFVRNLS